MHTRSRPTCRSSLTARKSVLQCIHTRIHPATLPPQSTSAAHAPHHEGCADSRGSNPIARHVTWGAAQTRRDLHAETPETKPIHRNSSETKPVLTNPHGATRNNASPPWRPRCHPAPATLGAAIDRIGSNENAAPPDPPGFIRPSLPSRIHPEAVFTPAPGPRACDLQERTHFSASYSGERTKPMRCEPAIRSERSRREPATHRHLCHLCHLRFSPSHPAPAPSPG
jgi:hypothetical protein